MLDNARYVDQQRETRTATTFAAVDKRAAAIGSALFFAAAPFVVAGVVPYLLTGWKLGDPRPALQILGGALLAACVPVLIAAFARFVREGSGTPAPVAPTSELVVGGLYRYVRNPMYLAVVGSIVGQAMLLGRGVLYVYALAVFILVYAFVRLYEQPELTRTYGPQYEAYCRQVPGWLPRRPRSGSDFSS
jgi:protein-S-isoprenylcysteine O-methyltransferase Ste14